MNRSENLKNRTIGRTSTLDRGDTRRTRTERTAYRGTEDIVEIPVEKPVLYEKCEACNRTAYQNAKAKYETQKERLAGQYKAKTVMFQTTLFLLAWYSLTTTLFQAVQSDMFLVDCKSFFNDLNKSSMLGWTNGRKLIIKIINGIIGYC